MQVEIKDFRKSMFCFTSGKIRGGGQDCPPAPWFRRPCLVESFVRESSEQQTNIAFSTRVVNPLDIAKYGLATLKSVPTFNSGRGELLDLTPLAKYTLGIKVVPINQANKVEPTGCFTLKCPFLNGSER